MTEPINKSTFSYHYYKQVFEKVKTFCNIGPFKTFDSSRENGIILRHDVDLDMRKAYDLAAIEQELGVRSTFFIMTTADTYNPCSTENRRYLQEMHDNGFEIGLHFDPCVYHLEGEKLFERVRAESAILEEIIADKISSISLHNPSLHNQYPVFEGYKNAYGKEYFNPEYYMSDSCMDFRGKKIIEFAQKGRNYPIQILLHPIHFSREGNDYIKIFTEVFRRRVNNLDEMMKKNNFSYRKLLNTDTLYGRMLQDKGK